MTIAAARQLRTVAFGTLDGGPWGAAWCAGSPIVLLAPATVRAPRPVGQATLTGSEQDESWQLAGDRVELEVSGEGEPAPIATDEAVVGFDQLCRVRGRALIGDAELTVDCPGLRGAHRDVDVRDYRSVRRVCAWFDSGHGIALLALRPRKAKGHGRDVVAAALLDSGGATVVAEPRLSTTYTAEGTPARAGLELWLEEEEESEQYPRRAAGEVIAPGALVTDQGLELRAELFRWHRRGEEGAGVYLLARGG